MNTHVLMLIGAMSGFAPAGMQDPPPATPPPVTQPPVTQPPASSSPPSPQPVAAASPAVSATPVAEAPVTLSDADIAQRLDAIYVMEGTLSASVRLAAKQTATEIQRFQPGLMMFSSAPVKAHGTYLEGYGVIFHIEIPRVIPSVASMVEFLEKEREQQRGRGNPAIQTGVGERPSDAMMNPDAHYVQSVKTELINVMVKQSQSLALRPGETLTVSARDGSEMPGQVASPSTMTLQVKGKDLADFNAGRITLGDIIRRVSVRGF